MDDNLSNGDVIIWRDRPQLVEWIDWGGHVHLVDCEGETSMVHRSLFEHQRGLSRDIAKVLWEACSK